MAYNPFDDVIDQDPAYMQTSGRSVIPQKRADYTQETFKPVASAIAKGYSLLTPEQDTLDEIEKNKQLRALSTAQALKGTQFEEYAGQADLPSFVVQSPGIKERLDQAGYKPQGFIEGMSRIGQFFYGDQRQAFDKLAQGQQLTDQDRTAIAFAPLDTLDFLFPPLAIKKLGSMGLKTVDDVLKSSADIEEVKQIKNYFGGQGFTPAGVMRAPEDGGSSLPKGLQIGHDMQSAARLEKKNKLLKVIDDAKQSGKKYKQKLDIYKEAGISKFVGKDLGDQFPEIRQDTDFLINKPDKPNKDVVLDFLKQNPNKKYTIAEIAESTGLEYKQVNKVKETNRKEIADRFVSPKDEGRQRRNDMREYLNNLPEGSYVPSDFLAKEFNTTANEVGVFLQNDPQYRSKVRMANTFDFGFDRGFETVPQFLMKYMDDTMNDGRLHYRDEILDVDFNGNKISNKQLSAFFQNYKDYKKYFASTEFQQKGKGRDIPRVLNENKQELGYTIVGSGPRNAEYNFLYDYLRSADPNLYPDFKGSKAEFYQMLLDDLKSKNWKELYREDIDTIRELNILKKEGTEKIKNLFDTYSEQYPQQFKNLDKGDFVLHLAHNFPLQLMRGDFGFAGSLKGSTRLSLARTNLEHHREIEEEIAKIVKEVNQKYVDKGVGPQTKQKIPPEINKKLAELDKKANKLGTVVYFKFGNQQYKVGNETPPSVDDLVNATEKYFQYVAKQKAGYKPRKTDKNFGDVEIPVGAQKEGGDVDKLTKAKGGAIKMARGGMDSILENINQQNFTPDPAIDGESAFQQAVKSGNLTAFNIPKVFKTLGDTFGVFTPKRASAPTATTAEGIDAGTALGAPPGQTLPATKPLQSEDFIFESFTLDKINSPTAPKAAKPQDWINYLQGGKDKAPSAELLDSGLFQYMADFEKFFPNQKMTKQQIVELYEQSPIANLKIKVKTDRTDASPYDIQTQETMGRSKHKNAGNAQIDAGGTDYREIVLEAGALPGEQKPYVNSTHFSEDNVLVFSRVANYDNKAGEQVAVIQELQTDLLTKVRKEQERLNSIIENKKLQVQRNNDIIQNPNRDNYDRSMAQENLTRLVPELNQLEKVKETNLISPYPMTVAKDLIPTYQKQLNDVQQEINTLIRSGIDRSDPEFLMKISELEAQQQKVLDDLLNLNRTSNFDELTKGLKIPATSDSEDLANIAQGRDNYMSMKDLETFPPIPFNKQPDYVDLIIKATIKDAEARGINKVAIMPADVGANPRWGKATLQMDREDKSSGDKFRNLYDKVGVQQLKNIAKKYGGQLNIEEIVDPQKSNLGLTFSTRNIEGDGFNFMKELDVDQSAISRGDLGPANRFLNEEILRVAEEMGPNEVIYRKEMAPGQTMDYFVKVIQTDTGNNFDLVPLKTGDRPIDAKILIEDRDPSAVKMYTITLPEKTKDKPFFLFRKKEGGKIPGDRLVSITDIYGDY